MRAAASIEPPRHGGAERAFFISQESTNRERAEFLSGGWKSNRHERMKKPVLRQAQDRLGMTGGVGRIASGNIETFGEYPDMLLCTVVRFGWESMRFSAGREKSRTKA